MPNNIQPYESQVQDTAPIPNTRATGADFGAQVGVALENAGKGLDNMSSALQQHIDRTDGIDGQLALANARRDMTQHLIQAENGPTAGSSNFTADFNQQFDQYYQKAAAGLPNNPKVQNAFKVAMADLQAQLSDRAMQSQASQGAQITAQKAQDTLSTYVNTVQTDPTQYDASVKAGNSLIDGLGLDPLVSGKLRDNFSNTMIAGRFDALFRAAKTPADVQGIVNDLENGDWKNKMSAPQFQDMLRVAKAAETSAQKVVNEEAQSAVTSVESRINGGARIDPSEMASVGSAVKASNNQVLIDKWTRLSATNDTTQRVQPMSSPALQQYIQLNKGGNVPDAGPNSTTGRAQEGFQYLQSKYGLDANMAVGVLANVGRETGFMPRPGDGGTSDGYFQWHKGDDFDRLTPARNAGATGTDIKKAIDYAMSEPQGKQWLMNVQNGVYKSAQDAAQGWMSIFERPKDPTADAPINNHWVQRVTEVVNGGKPLPNYQPGVTSEVASAAAPATTPGAPSEYEWLRAQAAQKVLQRRDAQIKSGDQMQAAADAGIFTLQPLTAATDFQERAAQSQQAQAFLGLKDNKPFTSEEVSSFNQVMQSGTLQQKQQLLQNVASMGQAAPAAFKQIGEKAPVFEHIGGLSSVSAGVAQDVLRGEQAMQDNPDLRHQLMDKTTGPGSGGTAQAFASVVGNSMAEMPRDAYGAREAADALYLQRVGFGANWNGDAYTQAVRDVLGGKAGDTAGGVVNINGQPTALPPGVNGDDFQTMLHSLTPQDLMDHSVGGGAPLDIQHRQISPQDIASEGKFQAVGANGYKVILADGFPAQGTGPAGFYVFQIDANGVKDILSRPAAQAYQATTLRGRVAGAVGSLPPLSNITQPGNAADRFMQTLFPPPAPGQDPQQAAQDALKRAAPPGDRGTRELMQNFVDDNAPEGNPGAEDQQ